MRLIFLVSTKMMGIEAEQWVEAGVGEERICFARLWKADGDMKTKGGAFIWHLH